MSRPVAYLYFDFPSLEVAKDLAARVRNDGPHCYMVVAGNFNGPGQVEGCSAVLIQKSSGGAQRIAEAYRAVQPETEIHFFDDEGKFVEEEAPPESDDADKREQGESKDPDPAPKKKRAAKK